MSQAGFVSCGCCGNLFKADGSEDHLHDEFLKVSEEDAAEIPHTFKRNEEGLWWCEVEDVNADECSDETRCENECFCNDREEVKEDEEEG